jgi:branched-chain amino acid transport system permease protein
VARWSLIAVAAAALVVYPFVTDSGQTFLMSVIFLDAIVGLSLVVLTGWAGQVSLGQFGFAAIGGLVAAYLAQHAGVSFWLAVPIASLVTAGVAVLVGIPALRIPGLYLAVATFAFAAVVQDLFFDRQLFGWAQPSGGVSRPQLFVIDFDDQRAMYFLCAVALALSIVLVVNLRRGRFGRVLIAVRENEANAEAAGISVMRMKLAAFGVAGLMCGFAGALLAFQQQSVNAADYSVTASITAFVQVVIGGISSVFGPLLGSGYVNGLNFSLSGVPEVATALVTVAPLLLLYAAPGGLLSVMARMRDAVLRIIAQRNQLVVPSLFADMDPAALHLRLIPLAPPLPGSGTQAAHRKYRLWTSRLVHRGGAISPEVQSLAAAARTAQPHLVDAEPAG